MCKSGWRGRFSRDRLQVWATALGAAAGAVARDLRAL
jgi:hypothetical protein